MPSTPSSPPSRRGLPFLLARDLGHVGVQHALLWERAAQKVPDDQPRAVRIRQDDQAARLRRAAQQRQQLPVVHHGKAVRLKDHRVHNLAERIFIISSLDDDRLFNVYHCAPPGPAPQAAPPAPVPGRPGWPSCRGRPASKSSTARRQNPSPTRRAAFIVSPRGSSSSPSAPSAPAGLPRVHHRLRVEQPPQLAADGPRIKIGSVCIAYRS